MTTAADAWWVAHAEFGPAVIRRLEQALGRPVSRVEIDYLQNAIEVPASWHRNRYAERVSAPAQQARLRALLAYPAHALASAFWALDGYTTAVLVTELAHAGVPLQRVDRDPVVIRRAAQAALDHWHPRRRGRPAIGNELYRTALRLWRRLGGADGSAAARPGYATPLVRFACALLEGGGICLAASTVAKHLRHAQIPGAVPHLLDTQLPSDAEI